ncbi:TPA: Arc family DNA-binding protein [Citrobacter freundii]
MSEKFPSQMQDKFTVRFPDGLRDAVADRAKRNGRSMNSEIIQIIEDAITPERETIEVRNSASRIASSSDSEAMILNQQETIDLQSKIIENLKAKINLLNTILSDSDGGKP